MKSSLNLMSERSRKRRQMRGCVRLWSRVIAVVMLALTVGGIAQWRVCHLEQVKRAAAEAEYEPIRQLKYENGRLRKQIALFQETERISLELAKHEPLLGLVGLATQSVSMQQGQVYLQQIEIEREPISIDPAKLTTGPPKLSFGLVGTSIDSSAITRLTDSLRELGPFASVELSTSKTTQVGKQSQQSFSVQGTN